MGRALHSLPVLLWFPMWSRVADVQWDKFVISKPFAFPVGMISVPCLTLGFAQNLGHLCSVSEGAGEFRGFIFLPFPFVFFLCCTFQGSCDVYLLCFIGQGGDTSQVSLSTPKFYMNIIILSDLAYFRKSLQIDTSVRFLLWRLGDRRKDVFELSHSQDPRNHSTQGPVISHEH